MVATNSGGTTDGTILNFTTAAPPVPAATTAAATSITSTGATLHASVNPEGGATTYDFVYGTSSSLSSGTITTTSASAGSGTSAVSESTALTGLTPDTKYYFKVVATNAGGTTDGTILNFTTSAASGTPPAATTKPATSITSTGATLNSSLNPEGRATTYSFVYGTSSSLSSGTTATTSASAGSGTSAVSESAALNGLTPDTTYYFKVEASNSGGTTDGTIVSFKSSARRRHAPHRDNRRSHIGHLDRRHSSTPASTRRATPRPTTSSTAPARALSSGTTTTTSESAGSGTTAESETAALTGLTPDTKYYFKVVATNSGGPTNGTILSFTTPAVINTQPLVTLTSLTHPTIKVGTGKKAKKEAVLELQFSGPLSGAGGLGAYVLESGKTKKGKTTYSKRVALTSAVYDYPGAPPDTVTLFLKSKLNLSLREQLTVNGSMITDSNGRPLAQSYVVQFSGKGITIG